MINLTIFLCQTREIGAYIVVCCLRHCTILLLLKCGAIRKVLYWHTVVLSEALYHCTAVETFHNQEDVVLAISARLVLLNSSRILDY